MIVHHRFLFQRYMQVQLGDSKSRICDPKSQFFMSSWVTVPYKDDSYPTPLYPCGNPTAMKVIFLACHVVGDLVILRGTLMWRSYDATFVLLDLCMNHTFSPKFPLRKRCQDFFFNHVTSKLERIILGERQTSQQLPRECGPIRICIAYFYSPGWLHSRFELKPHRLSSP